MTVNQALAYRNLARPATRLFLSAVLVLVGVAQGPSAAAALPEMVSPATANSTTPVNVLTVSGAFVETLKLDRADCTSTAHDPSSAEALDVFGASTPSIRSTWPGLVVTAEKPEPNNAMSPDSGAIVDVVLNSPEGDSGWYASKVSNADISFSRGSRAGKLDLTLMPAVGTNGVLFLSVTWTDGTCSTLAQRIQA